MKTNLLSALKSKTFWGALGFAIIQVLYTQGIISESIYGIASSGLAGLGFYGARNTKA